MQSSLAVVRCTIFLRAVIATFIALTLPCRQGVFIVYIPAYKYSSSDGNRVAGMAVAIYEVGLPYQQIGASLSHAMHCACVDA